MKPPKDETAPPCHAMNITVRKAVTALTSGHPSPTKAGRTDGACGKCGDSERFHLRMAVIPLLETEIKGPAMVERVAQAPFRNETFSYPGEQTA